MTDQHTTLDPHAGLTCEQVEQVAAWRTRQYGEAREDARQAHRDLDALRAALAYRGDEAEEVDAALAAIARIDAVARGDIATAEVLRPTTPWTSAIHAGTMLRVLAEFVRIDPDLVPTLRRQLLEVAAGTAPQEEGPTDAE